MLTSHLRRAVPRVGTAASASFMGRFIATVSGGPGAAPAADAAAATAASSTRIPKDGLTLQDFMAQPPHNPQISTSGCIPATLSMEDLNEAAAAAAPADGTAPAVVPSRRQKEKVPKPSWLRMVPPSGANYERMRDTVRELKLSTVCEEARCPNIGECWGGKKGHSTATVMLMGDTCTRACRFCAVKTSRTPPPLDPHEPANMSDAILRWGLDYVVFTIVTRDDLPDGGAEHIAETVRRLKAHTSPPLVEALTSDFGGRLESVDTVVHAGLDVFAHNIETVESLQSVVRDRRNSFERSLAVLGRARQASPEVITKTSLMLGCGEKPDEIRATLRALREVDCNVVTFGQYLRPSPRHLRVEEFITPEAFQGWQQEAEAMGFLYVASGPLVRSSYKAGEFFIKNVLDKRRAKAGAATADAAAEAAPAGTATAL